MQKIDIIEYLPKIMSELKKGVLVNTKHNNIPNELYERFYKNTPSSDGTITNDDYHTVYYGEIVNAYII